MIIVTLTRLDKNKSLQGAIWRAPFKSFSPRSVFGKSRLRGLLVIARSLLAVAKKSGGPSKG